MYVGKQFKANPLWQWTKITKSLHCSNLEICWFWLKIHENCRDCQFSTFMGTLLLPLNSIYNNAPGPRPPKFFNKMHEIWRFILHLYLWNWYGLCEKIHFQKAPISAPCRFWGVPDPLNRNAPGPRPPKFFNKMHEISRFILHLYLWNWYGLCEKIHFQKAPISAPCRFWGVPDPLNRRSRNN